MGRFSEWLSRILGRAESAGQTRPTKASPSTGPFVHVGAQEGPRYLQFPGRTGQPTLTTDIVIGFDFGTSCARVAIQSPFKLDGRVVFVDFGPLGHGSSRYFLPSRIFVDSQGRLTLDSPQGELEVHSHLKVDLLDRFDGPATEDRALARATAYVAAALRLTRRYFLETQADSYGADEIRWSLNIGIPSAGYDDETIRPRFQRLARAAWELSLRAETPAMENVLEALGDGATASEARIDVDVVPEVAAQVVGYARSRERQDGLHTLMDVGASTLDLCSFVLHAHEADDNYELLTAAVEPLGLVELHGRRMDVAGGRPPFDAIPEDLVSALPDWQDGPSSGLPINQLRECDERFMAMSRRLLKVSGGH